MVRDKTRLPTKDVKQTGRPSRVLVQDLVQARQQRMILDSCFDCYHLTTLAKEGYVIALVAHGADSVKALAEEINTAGGTAAPFPISSHGTTDIDSA
ncbi:hypothetical protein IW261DRAFT_1567158 [Armillaria novae-zelandiae]|uniref:Uncharacterized protein n=1 Tax=Armillaria novae-zelandiae TaxID=153914 RepID=A0AA39P3G2_9AGAR|nr:hypothetical protein IW261DRAFT_1567158 [Armillaria novae-zelandiae]